MASGIDRRVKALEAIYNEEPCPECGWDGDLTNIDYEVCWDYLDSLEEPQNRELASPEFCGACGHQLVYVVEWLDLPNEEGRERALR